MSFSTLESGFYDVQHLDEKILLSLQSSITPSIAKSSTSLSTPQKPEMVISNKVTQLLFLACYHNDATMVKKLVELVIHTTYCDVNQRNEYGWSLLGIACCKGYTQVVKALLTHPDIDINYCGHYDINNSSNYVYCSPLFYACMYGHNDIVKLLLKRKDISINNGQFGSIYNNYTPLMAACENNSYNIIHMLLNNQHVDVKHTCLKHQPLHTLSSKRTVLTPYDYHTSYKQRDYNNTLYIHSKRQQVNAMDLLLEHNKVKDKQLQDGDISVIEHMLKRGEVKLSLHDTDNIVYILNSVKHLLLDGGYRGCGHDIPFITNLMCYCMNNSQCNKFDIDNGDVGDQDLIQLLNCLNCDLYSQLFDDVVNWYITNVTNNSDVTNHKYSKNILYGVDTNGKLFERLMQVKLIDVNCQDLDGNTLLHNIVKLPYSQIPKCLMIRPDLNINIKNHSGDTPLNCAIDQDYQSTTTCLLQRDDIDVKLADSKQYPILTDLIHNECFEAAIRAIELGVSVNNNALLICVNDSHTNIISKLLSRSDLNLNMQDSDGDTALHIAIHNLNYPIINMLLDTYIARSTTSLSPCIPLSTHPHVNDVVDTAATPHDNKDIITTTHSNDDVVTTSNDSKNMRLINSECMEGVDINIRNDEGLTVLHKLIHVIENSYNYRVDEVSSQLVNDIHEIVSKILSVPGIDVNIKDNNFQTPLHDSIELLNFTVVELLLKPSTNFTIDVNMVNCHGLTPFHYFVVLCQSSDGFHDDNTSLLVLDYLLSRTDVNVNITNEVGNTLLHTICRNGMYSVLMRMLDRDDIDVNARNKYGWTPLMSLTTYVFDEILPAFSKYLLDPRTKVNTVNNQGRTVLDIVCSEYGGYDTSDLNIIKYLLAARATTSYNLKDTQKLLITQVHEPGFSQESVYIQDYDFVIKYWNDPNILIDEQIMLDPVSKVFTTVVLLCDNYYKLKTPNRFYQICCKLPMDLQMLLCHRIFGSSRKNITGALVTAQAKKLLNA